MIYVFTGPTLCPDEARPLLEATYLPPVAQGDVYRLVERGSPRPAAIGIIDGYFQTVPSVWHKEILWALSRGVHVYGAASMGALRAAELDAFGMVGVGAIFEAYRSGALTDDDEVAIAHGTAESGFRVLSEAMVNVRATLAAAEARAVISRDTRATLEHAAKELFYPDRIYPRILARGAERGLPPVELAAFARFVEPGAATGRIDQKRLDALALLRALDAWRAASPGPKQVRFFFETTDAWESVRRALDEDSR